MTDSYPAAEKHLPPHEVFPGVWVAPSSISMPIPLGLRIRFSRNMVAVLQDDGWVLINPVRIGQDAEKEMLAKGPFRHAVRLGTFHGQDDRYYVEKHGAKFWAVAGDQKYTEPPIAQAITEDGPFPIPGAKVVIFKGAKLAECVVFLPRHRLLLTCDSVQHYELDEPLISFLGRILMKRMGFFTPCVIGPIWVRQVTPKGGSLKPDFQRILALDFDNLISAHGVPKIGGAKAALSANVAKLA